MHVEEIRVTDYRNYANLCLALEPGLTIISGDNGQGKTNLLEAIYLLSGRSPLRFGGNAELVRWGAATAIISGRVSAGAGAPEVTLTIGTSGRRMQINGTKPRSLRGSPLAATLFCPDTLSLVKEGASARRDLVDTLLERLQPAFSALRSDYGRVLRQRNKVLQRSEERAALEPWDGQLIELGTQIVIKRASLVRRMSPLVSESYATLSARSGACAQARYSSRLLEGRADGDDQDEEGIRARFQALIEERRREELARGLTVVGPHRDDVALELEGRPLREFGSQGEQRCAALSLVLAEAGLLQESSGERPVLLLDDVLSELDELRRARLLEAVSRGGQTIVTTTKAEGIGEMPRARMLRVSGGEVVDEGRARIARAGGVMDG